MSTAIQSYPLVSPTSEETKKKYPFSWPAVYVDTMVWDEKRHGLWCMDNKGVLILIEICKYEDVMGQVRAVPELAVFPPGVLPICIGYLENIDCGAARVVAQITQFSAAIVPDVKATRRLFDMPSFSVCVDPSSGNLYIAGGDSFILQYEPDTRHFSRLELVDGDNKRETKKWIRIVSNGKSGYYFLAADNGCSYLWSGRDRCCNMIGSSFCEDPRIAVAVRNGLVFQVDESNQLYSIDMDKRSISTESKLPVDSWNRVYPTLVGSSDPNVQIIYMLTDTHITTITPKHTRRHGKDQVRWQCTGLPIPWTSSDKCYPFPVNGLCNGMETMFFPTNNRSAIDYLALPPIPSPFLQNKKRKHADVIE